MSRIAKMQKWYCTDCSDTFNDETGERCPQCGFRRVIGPLRYNTAEEIERLLSCDQINGTA